ncbi:MAG: PaaI family thioesterase [Nitratireductor sp.]
MEPSFGTSDADDLLATVFAPWVRALKLKATGFDANGGDFTLPENRDLCLSGGPGTDVICGQAVMAVADTVSVLTLAGVNKRFRNCTTLDMATNFLRPLMLGPVSIRGEVLSNGRKSALVRVEMRQALDGKPLGKLAATANCAFLYLED